MTDISEELCRLHELLETESRFDEEHWIEVAQSSPGLCTGEYAAASLVSAHRIASDDGLSHVAAWIAWVLEFAAAQGHARDEPGAESGQPPADPLRK